MKIVYTSLDPFYTFEAQRDWYHNPSSVYYYQNLNGAIINSFIKQKIFKRQPPSVSDVDVADEVYKTLEDYKAKTDALFSQIDTAAGTRTDEQRKLVAQAHAFYDAYSYLDAFRTASAVLGRKE
jgi:hypothetical protein